MRCRRTGISGQTARHDCWSFCWYVFLTSHGEIWDVKLATLFSAPTHYGGVVLENSKSHVSLVLKMPALALLVSEYLLRISPSCSFQFLSQCTVCFGVRIRSGGRCVARGLQAGGQHFFHFNKVVLTHSHSLVGVAYSPIFLPGDTSLVLRG